MLGIKVLVKYRSQKNYEKSTGIFSVDLTVAQGQMRKSMMCGFVSPPGSRAIETKQTQVVAPVGIASDFVVKNEIRNAIGVIDESFFKDSDVA